MLLNYSTNSLYRTLIELRGERPCSHYNEVLKLDFLLIVPGGTCENERALHDVDRCPMSLFNN